MKHVRIKKTFISFIVLGLLAAFTTSCSTSRNHSQIISEDKLSVSSHVKEDNAYDCVVKNVNTCDSIKYISSNKPNVLTFDYKSSGNMPSVTSVVDYIYLTNPTIQSNEWSDISKSDKTSVVFSKKAARLMEISSTGVKDGGKIWWYFNLKKDEYIYLNVSKITSFIKKNNIYNIKDVLIYKVRQSSAHHYYLEDFKIMTKTNKLYSNKIIESAHIRSWGTNPSIILNSTNYYRIKNKMILWDNKKDMWITNNKISSEYHIQINSELYSIEKFYISKDDVLAMNLVNINTKEKFVFGYSKNKGKLEDLTFINDFSGYPVISTDEKSIANAQVVHSFKILKNYNNNSHKGINSDSWFHLLSDVSSYNHPVYGEINRVGTLSSGTISPYVMDVDVSESGNTRKVMMSHTTNNEDIQFLQTKKVMNIKEGEYADLTMSAYRIPYSYTNGIWYKDKFSGWNLGGTYDYHLHIKRKNGIILFKVERENWHDNGLDRITLSMHNNQGETIINGGWNKWEYFPRTVPMDMIEENMPPGARALFQVRTADYRTWSPSLEIKNNGDLYISMIYQSVDPHETYTHYVRDVNIWSI